MAIRTPSEFVIFNKIRNKLTPEHKNKTLFLTSPLKVYCIAFKKYQKKSFFEINDIKYFDIEYGSKCVFGI